MPTNLPLAWLLQQNSSFGRMGIFISPTGEIADFSWFRCQKVRSIYDFMGFMK